MIKRNIIADIQKGLADTPAILINGARQTGKSTLMKALLGGKEAGHYFSLDDATVLNRAIQSPKLFLQSLSKPVGIDEVQRAENLFLALKELIDDDRKPGEYLLTGSANVLDLPKIADSLAGRIEIHPLWPLSQGELIGRKEAFVDTLFGEEIPDAIPGVRFDELLNKVQVGGYPEVVSRRDPERREAWFRSYITLLLEKDVRDLANISGLTQIPDLLSLLATRVGGLINTADISRTLGIPNTTLKSYMSLLDTLFLTVKLPAWSRNIGKRLIKSPKGYLNDTGLLCYLLGVDGDYLSTQRHVLGALIENFVVMEIKKQCTWSKTLPKLYHFRTSYGEEVGLVLEKRNGQLVGIEIKVSENITSKHLSGLQLLQSQYPEHFHRGVVLYLGDKVIPMGEKIHAMPLSALWEIER